MKNLLLAIQYVGLVTAILEELKNLRETGEAAAVPLKYKGEDYLVTVSKL